MSKSNTGFISPLHSHSSISFRSLPLLLLIYILLLLCILSSLVLPAEAFRFTARPGHKICFTEYFPEAGRYELHYKMARSLTPFVSVAITAPDGGSVIEHEIAQPDAKEIISVDSKGNIAICFNVASKSRYSATSMNITLEIMDAEDAELTRQKRQSYSTSSPIGVGVGKASGAMQQMKYIYQTTLRIRRSYLSLMAVGEDMQFSFKDMNDVAWNYVYIFAGMSGIILCGTYFRLRQYFKIRKYI